MGKKKNRSNLSQSYSNNDETDDSNSEFAANLLASMGIDEKKESGIESVPENPLEEVDTEKESFEERHPHLSSIHKKFRKVFGREGSYDEAEELNKETEDLTVEPSGSAVTSSHSNQQQQPQATAVSGVIDSTNGEQATKDEPVGIEASKTASSETQSQQSSSESEKPKGKRRNRRREKLQQREQERVQMINDATNEAKTEEDKRLIELKGMGMMITKAGLVEEEVPPDGHCLFYSLCDQLKVRKGIETDAQALRSTLAAFIREHPDDFVPYLLDEETGELQDIQEYTKQLETTPLWGGDLEIQAASRVYESPIRIHFASQMPLNINDNLYANSEILHIAYYQAKFGLGAHYNSLRDNDKTVKELDL